MARHSKLDATAIAVLLGCCSFWGFQQTMIKATIAEVPAVWQASIRFAGAFALLWLWCKWRGIRLWQASDAQSGVLRGGFIAGLLFSAEFAGIYLGLKDTSASRLTVFLYTSPFVVALILPRFVAAEALRRVQWVGLAIAFAAVGIAFSEGFSESAAARLGANHLRGDALALAAGICWGLTTVVIRATALGRESPEKVLAYQLAAAALLMPMLSLATGEKWSFNYSAWAWASIALQTAVGAFASYLAWMWLLKHYPVNAISSFVFLTPIFALLFGAAWLGEVLSAQLLLGVVGVAVGIALVNRKPAS